MGLAKTDPFYCPHNFLNPNLLRIFLAKPIILLVHRTINNCLPIKKGECMKGMLESRGETVNRNDWEGILGKLDALADEINKALHLTTRIEEPRSGVRIAQHPQR
jgi:hypothetical protein